MSESRAEHHVPEVPAEPSPDTSSPSGSSGSPEVSASPDFLGSSDSLGSSGSSGEDSDAEHSTGTNSGATPPPARDEVSTETSSEGSVETSDDLSPDTLSTTETDAGETETAETEVAENKTGGATRSGATAPPAKLTFRITPISLLAVMTVAICVTPVAWFLPWLLVLYLLPLGLLVWILRVRTDVTADSITATALVSTRMSWDDIRSVKLNERRWVRAVLNSGKEVLLPAVRVRDLPHLAAMSDGRLPDPGAPR